MKNITILGSTGSIGTQTLDVCRKNPDRFKVTGLAAGSNLDLLEKQIDEFHPNVVSLAEEADALELLNRLQLKNNHTTKVVYGPEGIEEVACEESADITLNAVVGMKGILPTMAAIRAGKDIALANKETLVTAGHIIIPLINQTGGKLLPVDSEHSAIFQCLQGAGNQTVEKILLTASGGPFYGKTLEELKSITVEQALRHPNWAMGKKITIDSSTMVNKGLEVMEAGWLFGVTPDQIQVVIQPKSIIHSMVQFSDGAIIAQLGVPDMRLPIQYALTYPDRTALHNDRLDLFSVQKIEFLPPDFTNFPALSLAYTVFREGGSLPTVYNAANELAVASFLKRKIAYTDIFRMIENAVNHHVKIKQPSLEEVLTTERETYEYLKQVYKEIS